MPLQPIPIQHFIIHDNGDLVKQYCNRDLLLLPLCLDTTPDMFEDRPEGPPNGQPNHRRPTVRVACSVNDMYEDTS